MAKEVVTELEVLFTANTDQVDKAKKDVQKTAQDIEKKPVKAKVEGDAKDALASMERVEAEAKKIVSAKTVATVDANIERAEKNLNRTRDRLEYLRSVETDLEVSADITRAEKALERAERQRDALVSARSKLEVDADTAKAESELDQLEGKAEDSGKDAGKKAGAGLVSNLDGATRGAGEKVGQVVGGDIGSSLEDALTAIPVAGGIVLAGVAIGKAIVGSIQDGMQLEVGVDRLQALTGLDPVQARRMADAAAEAYVGVFGESVEANMRTSRIGLQFDLIDPDASTRSASLVVKGLAGIADVLEEDVQPVAQAVTTMLRTGIVKSADEAFDVLAAGAREGVNVAEDLLDTFVEYPALFARLGLDADEALGLLNQGLEGGARNADLVADALKEFQIRSTDASESSAEGFEAIGLNAEAMTSKIAAGGEGAREGLAQVLEGLRNMEDPVQRNLAGVALFGTQWEDLGDAIGNLDLSTAVSQLGEVEGAARTMFDTLADNDATKMEEASRNIEVAADGIKGAMAAAFSEPLGDFADWVSTNRGPMMQFFSDMVNGAIDFAQTANTSFGDFVSGPLASMVRGLGTVVEVFGGDASEIKDFAREMQYVAADTDAANAKLEEMRGTFNEFADGQIALGYVHDAAKRTALMLDEVGVAADGSVVSMTGLETANLRGTESGRVLDEQLAAIASSLGEELVLAARAGETQEDLAGRYAATTEALRDQLVEMGFTGDEADALISTYLKVPEAVATDITAPGAEEAAAKAVDFRERLEEIPKERRAEVRAALDRGDIATVEAELEHVRRERTVRFRAAVDKLTTGPKPRITGTIDNHDGNIVVPMAGGGSLTPMAPIAQAVPPNTWRVVGDRMKDREFYIPDDGSARSLAILLEAVRSFGLMPMATGAVAEPRGSSTAVPAPRRAGNTTIYLTGREALAAFFEHTRDADRLRYKREGVHG